jgi:hypothetical protein
MRTDLRQVAGRLLMPLVLVGCQETSTTPGEEGGGEIARGPGMNPATAATGLV